MMYSCICHTDYESPSVAGCKDVVARKTHRCCECGEAINPGDTYERVRGCWDGSWSEFKTCAICARIRADMCDCWEYGTLWDDLWETNGLNPDQPPTDDDGWWGDDDTEGADE